MCPLLGVYHTLSYVVGKTQLETENEMKTWEEFNRLKSATGGFYGCVAPDGEWFDSSVMYTTAVHWCCMNAGASNATHSYETEAQWMNTEGMRLGYSIVHSSMLEKMHEKGLLK